VLPSPKCSLIIPALKTLIILGQFHQKQSVDLTTPCSQHSVTVSAQLEILKRQKGGINDFLLFPICIQNLSVCFRGWTVNSP